MNGSSHNATAAPFPVEPGARGGLWPWLAVSCAAHLALILLISSAGGVQRLPPPERMRLAFADAERARTFVDVPEYMPDEGKPPPDARHIGTSELLARDPGTEARSPDTPHVEEGSEAPVFKPGAPVPEDGVAAAPPEQPGDPSGDAGFAETNGADTAREEHPPEDAPPQDEPPEPAPAPDAPPDDEDQPTADEAEKEAPPAPSPDERRRPAPGPPRLVARLPGTQLLAAFPREGYIQETPEGGLPRPGAAQYNVRWEDYAPYYRHLFRRIEAVFRLRRLHFRRPFQAEGVLSISIAFRVKNDGEFTEVTVLEDGGAPLLASDIAAGVRSASPVDPFPDYIEEDSLNLRIVYYLE